MKICKICLVEKDLSSFRFRNDTKKHRNTCKYCELSIKRKAAKESPEDYKKAKKREYIKNNETYKKYRLLNRESNNLKHKLWSRTLKGKYSCMVRVSRKLKREMTISFEQYVDIIGESKCKYCPRYFSKDTGYSLNRIDNEVGYIISNVEPCCKICNNVLKDYTFEELEPSLTGILNNYTHRKV